MLYWAKSIGWRRGRVCWCALLEEDEGGREVDRAVVVVMGNESVGA